MTCGDCSDDGAACVTCNTGYELSGTKCTVIVPPSDGPLGAGSSWLWWVIGIVVVCLLLVGIAWFVMKKGHKEGSMQGDDNIEMHHDTDQHGTHY